MPAKLTHTQEASFLLDIIKHSDLKSINWQALADKKQIKKGAAQMRYQRLKQAIEKAEAVDGSANINVTDNTGSDGGQSPCSPNSKNAPVTPKKPRANKIEKPKTPSSGRKRKIAVDTTMASPSTSMMSASPSVSTVSMHSQSNTPPTPTSQIPYIKMEPKEYAPMHQAMPPVAPGVVSHQIPSGMAF